MEIDAIIREARLWRVQYKYDGAIRYTYYSTDKFKDELHVFTWWQEQMSNVDNITPRHPRAQAQAG